MSVVSSVLNGMEILCVCVCVRSSTYMLSLCLRCSMKMLLGDGSLLLWTSTNHMAERLPASR